MAEQQPAAIRIANIRTEHIAAGTPDDDAIQVEMHQFLAQDDLCHYFVAHDEHPGADRRNGPDYVVFAWYSSYHERWHIAAMEMDRQTDEAVAAACIASTEDTSLPRELLWLAIVAVADLTRHQSRIILLAPASEGVLPEHIDVASDSSQYERLRSALAVGLKLKA